MGRIVSLGCASMLVFALVLAGGCASTKPAPAPSVSTSGYFVLFPSIATDEVTRNVPPDVAPRLQSHPQFVRDHDGHPAIGPFRYKMDALVFASKLSESAPYHIVALDGGFNEAANPLDLLPRFFNAKEASSSQIVPQKLPDTTRKSELDKLNAPETRDEYKNGLLVQVKSLSPKDPLLGYAFHNLGILAMKAKDYNTARANLFTVASGDVASSADDRLMAMWRLAWVTHNGDKKLPAAYRLYAETERFSDDPAIDAKCLAEMSGIAAEMAKDNKAFSFAESRQIEDELLARIDPAAFPEQVSTIKLIRLESYYYENDYQGYLDRVPVYLQDYAGKVPTRNIGMARLFQGMAYHHVGNDALAFETLESLAREPRTPDSAWAAIPDMRAHAYRWLVSIANQAGDKDRAASYAEDLAALEKGGM